VNSLGLLLAASVPQAATGVIPEERQMLYYIGATALTLLVLVGIWMMSKVETSVNGNLLGSVSMLLAIFLTMWAFGIFGVVDLWIFLLIGTFLGLVLTRRVKMIEMPEVVGLLNGFGGAASMIAGMLSLMNPTDDTAFSLVTSGLAIVVGSLTFTGSSVAAAKLHRLMPQKPVVLPNHAFWTGATLIASLISSVLFVIEPFRTPLGDLNGPKAALIIFSAVASGLFGYIFAIRVGGADMPITISLLNSFSGVAGSIAGLAISDPLLVAVGAIVGASGLLLTQIMCRSMNRNLIDILLGKTSAPTASVASEPAAVEPAAPVAAEVEVEPEVEEEEQDPAANSITWLRDAKRVIVVPGYGMALSQAQQLVKDLLDELTGKGKEVDFAIHPVAGRMPGHMNVLLAEVDVPYDRLREMESINDEFKDADVAIVIGANDVLNPAANTAVGTPIYGMPILNVKDARHVIICNFDTKPGYAGVPNPLYEEGGKRIALLLGDAKESLSKILDGLRS